MRCCAGRTLDSRSMPHLGIVQPSLQWDSLEPDIKCASSDACCRKIKSRKGLYCR
jgi:hypothetical protein